MENIPDPAEIPTELSNLIRLESNWRILCEAWDGMYPQNPVSGDENEA